MSRRREKNVGVIGLGIIGSRVAQNLRRRGFHVFVWNRTPRPFPNFVGSRPEVAELCDLIQIFVSDDDALLETIENLKRSLKSTHIVMVHSTVAPHTIRAAAEIVQRRGAQFVDAPFTGSKAAAEKGELVYYLGGDEAAFRRARPALEASSKEIIEIGAIGQATTVKLATNMITATTVQAAAEALALVHGAGLSPEKFAEAMRGNGSQSGTLAMKLPKMIEGDFEPHFSIKHMLKDVQIATRLGRSQGLNFGATEAARESLRSEMAEGRGDLDYAAVIQVYFPDGSPLQAARDAAAAAEEQQTLDGLDEEAASEAPARVEEPQSVARGAAAPEAKTDRSADGDKVDEAADVSAAATADRGAEDKPADGQSEVVEPTTSDDEDEDDVAAEEPKVAEVTSALDKPAAKTDADDAADEAPMNGEGDAEQSPAAPPESKRLPETVAVGAGESKRSGEIADGDAEARRGLFSRMFGKGGGDY
jgi:3-hydroxyisobutyrate dehydrogenase-like beta-hydroxyacid dehydrogenase